MDDSCLLVFTSQTVERMARQGGSQAWVVDAKRARTCRYLVCCWNSTGEGARTTEGRQHREAFLVAPITSVEPASAPEEAGRYDIRFVKFAELPRGKFPDVWTGKRNPVYYTALGELGIDPDALTFEPVSEPTTPELPAASSSASSNLSPLPIAAAKPRLAAYYNVPVEAVEIVIRG